MAALRGSDGVRDGVRALDQADWDAARVAFESALDALDTADAPAASGAPEAHEGLGLALWFLGRVPEGIAERERA